MISAAIVGLALGAPLSPKAPVQLGTRVDLSVRPFTLTPQARLEAARRATRGLGTIESIGNTRVRTFLEKGTNDLRIGANTPQAFSNGVARFGSSSAFWVGFRAKPSKLYAVTVVGSFDCTSVLWRQDSQDPAAPGAATLPIGAGESAAVLGLKAYEKEVVVFVSQPKGGKAQFLVERVEVTELN